MAKLQHQIDVSIELKATITLNETELRALDGMFGYGAKEFLRGFYKQCGKSYVQPFESGVISLHEEALPQIREALAKINQVRNKLK